MKATKPTRATKPTTKPDDAARLEPILRQMGCVLATLHDIGQSKDCREYIAAVGTTEFQSSKDFLSDILAEVARDYAKAGGFGRFPE